MGLQEYRAGGLEGWGLSLALSLVGPYTPALGLSFPSCKSRQD